MAERKSKFVMDESTAIVDQSVQKTETIDIDDLVT